MRMCVYIWQQRICVDSRLIERHQFSSTSCEGRLLLCSYVKFYNKQLQIPCPLFNTSLGCYNGDKSQANSVIVVLLVFKVCQCQYVSSDTGVHRHRLSLSDTRSRMVDMLVDNKSPHVLGSTSASLHCVLYCVFWPQLVLFSVR